MSAFDLQREREKLLWLQQKVADQERVVEALERIARDLELRKNDPLDAMFEQQSQKPAAPPAEPSTTLHSTAPAVHDAEPVQTPARQAPAPARLVVAAPWSPTWTRPVRRIPDHWKAILRFIGAEGKSSNEVREFIEAAGNHLTWDTARAGLMNYRRDFGLLESDKRGQYRLSTKGLAAITATEDESPDTSDGALESQPTTKEAAHTA